VFNVRLQDLGFDLGDKMKKLALLLVLCGLLMGPVVAQDDDTKGQFYLGYIYNHMKPSEKIEEQGLYLNDSLNLNGFNAGGDIHLGGNSVTDSISLAFDLGGTFSNRDSHDDSRLDVYTGTVGPQFTSRKHKHLHPFVRALFGVSFLKSTFNSVKGDDLGLAFIGGGGLDIRAGKHFAWRMVSVDYVMLRHHSTRLDNFRVGTAIVFPF
jgi:hypothetical protein